jgi:hypothetical protein
MHGGSRLIIDSGTCSYGDPKYTTYYRQSEVHNVVLFDGRGQPLEVVDVGTKLPGSIVKSLDGAGIRFYTATATGPMSHLLTRNYRSFLWMGNCILIIDDIAAHGDGVLNWLLHTAGAAQIGADGNQLSIRNSNVAISFSMLHPAVRFETHVGFAPQRPDQKLQYYSFSAATESRRQCFVSAIDLNPSDPARFHLKKTE